LRLEQARRFIKGFIVDCRRQPGRESLMRRVCRYIIASRSRGLVSIGRWNWPSCIEQPAARRLRRECSRQRGFRSQFLPAVIAGALLEAIEW
jgi:hypothetical protein